MTIIRTFRIIGILAGCCLCCFMANGQAQDTGTATIDTTIDWVLDMPTVKVLGEKPRLMSDIPGAAAFIAPATLRAVQPLSGNEVLRTVAGVNVVEEEGAGLRANIGIRGLDPDRSSRVLVLEDGIPVALNPYGEPQMYYTPLIDRMESMEVLKGSGQVLFGPQTIGGVINYITADPPATPRGRIRLNGGQGGFLSALAGYGGTWGNTGFTIDYLRKQADNIGPTRFQINDINTKIKLLCSSKAQLTFKFGYFDEISNATYIGLTQTMYDKGGQDYQIMAPHDQLKVRRLSASAVHDYRFNLKTRLQTTAFAYTTTRNWIRQDFSSSSTTSNQTGVVWGDAGVPGGAVYMRNQNGHRNRQFEVAGLMSVLQHHWNIGAIDSKLQFGARYLYEKASEQRINGAKADARSGALINDETRPGQAFSAFIHNRMELSEGWSLTAGIRWEDYTYERNIIRQNSKDTSIVASNHISQLIPGVGINYAIRDQWTFFAGLHRGFSPPRVADAITTAGEVYNLKPELSWNAELGLRSRLANGLNFELTGFYMNFSNQIIPISESSGGNGTGLVNGGGSLHSGVESALEWAFGNLFLPEGHALSLSANGTWVRAVFSQDRWVSNGDTLVNIKNNRTPYAPEWMVYSVLQYSSPWGLQLRLAGNFVGAQFTDELNTIIPAADGRTGQMDAYFTLDAGVRYLLEKPRLAFSASVKNLTNERYIASRRPQGIKVGLPRFVTAGLEWSF